MLGAIIGDIAGSVYEFNNCRSKQFEPFFHINARYTDDTICTVAIADALLNDIPPAESLRHWGRTFWNKGSWGKQFALWLAEPELAPPYDSFGNGSAMRVSPCAWLASSHKHALQLAESVTVATHTHPEGIKGALATTSAIYMAREGISPLEIKQFIENEYQYDLSRSVDEIRENNPRSEACQKTVPESIVCALESKSFEDAIRNAISIGGDSDTIGAITGSIAEAIYAVPENFKQQTLKYLPNEMNLVMNRFYDHLRI